MSNVPQEIRNYIDGKFAEPEENQDTKWMIVEAGLTDAMSLAFGQLIAKGVCLSHELKRIFEQFEEGIKDDYRGDSDEDEFIREGGARILQQLRSRAGQAGIGELFDRASRSETRH